MFIPQAPPVLRPLVVAAEETLFLLPILIVRLLIASVTPTEAVPPLRLQLKLALPHALLLRPRQTAMVQLLVSLIPFYDVATILPLVRPNVMPLGVTGRPPPAQSIRALNRRPLTVMRLARALILLLLPASLMSPLATRKEAIQQSFAGVSVLSRGTLIETPSVLAILRLLTRQLVLFPLPVKQA